MDRRLTAMALVLLFLASFISTVEMVRKVSAFIPHDPISINRNLEFTFDNGVTGGSGTSVDPFIIEGWEIDASSQSGIFIRNTDAHFIVREVYVFGSSLHSGIALENVTNGRMQELNITNVGNGIKLDSTRDIVMSESQTWGNGIGIWVIDSTGITISRNEIFSNSGYGISVIESSYLAMLSNKVYSNGDGISIRDSAYVSLSSSDIYSNHLWGVWLLSVSDFTAFSNNFTDDGLTLEGYSLKHFNSHNITEDNLVNGKAIFYYKDLRNLMLDDIDAGQLLIANSSNVSVSNLAISGTDIAIEVAFSSNISLRSNNISDCIEGIGIRYSSNATLYANSLSSNRHYGIRIRNSTRNDLSHNDISLTEGDAVSMSASSNSTVRFNEIYLNSQCGICEEYGSPNGTVLSNKLFGNSFRGIAVISQNWTLSSNNVSGSNFAIEVSSHDSRILHNNISNNIYGLEVYGVKNATIDSNHISNNSRGGLRLLESSNITISLNNISGNGKCGLNVDWSSNNTILANSIYENELGIKVERSLDNLIYHNNISQNFLQAYDDSTHGNQWDNGYPSGGNYWSDYEGIDNCSGPNQDVCPDQDGIGDSPYTIDADSTDKYPLVLPFGVVLPRPPTMLKAALGGDALENVTFTWSLSPDDGNGFRSVVRYEIHRSMSYDSEGLGYELVASLPNGTSTFTDNHAGEGDQNNYFYRVCAIDINDNSTCARNQAGKFTRPLSPGPNLVSIPLIQSNDSVEYVLQTVRYNKAWYYDSLSAEWKWFMKDKTYSRGLSSVDHTMGLWINVTEASSLTVAGVVPSQTSIQLYHGWNLVSFPSFNISYTVADLKVEIGATRVEGMETMPPFPPSLLRVLGDGDLLQAGYGYWVKVEADTTWVVGSV